MSGSPENTEELDAEALDPAVLAELDADASRADGLDADELSLDKPNPEKRQARLAAPDDPELDLTYRDANRTIDAHEDRWHWRRKIRSKPAHLRVYRIVVAAVGLILIVFGFLTGPIPGPGGIPLVLLGLAIWASEFEWAHRLMHWFKAQLRRFQSWTRLQQVLFWVVFFSGCGLLGYTYMVVLGIPGWVPGFADTLLQRLPGL